MSGSASQKQVRFQDLGRREYKDTWELQERLFRSSLDRKIRNKREHAGEPPEHYLLLVEHPPVYTLGKNGDMSNLLVSEDELKRKGATFFHIDRGGDITFHGPEQIVGYPILDLDEFYTDIHRYLRELEEVIIRTLADYDLKGDRSKGETGVWLDVGTPSARKICAMGIRASRWVTMHGFAFNINTDLSFFDLMVPCGIRDKQVTSLQKELGRHVPLEEVKARLLKHFSEVFEAEVVASEVEHPAH
jgi:lipoyl(octanoyl) transferase